MAKTTNQSEKKILNCFFHLLIAGELFDIKAPNVFCADLPAEGNYLFDNRLGSPPNILHIYFLKLWAVKEEKAFDFLIRKE